MGVQLRSHLPAIGRWRSVVADFVTIHPAYRVVERACRAWAGSQIQAAEQARYIVTMLAMTGNLEGEFRGEHFCEAPGGED